MSGIPEYLLSATPKKPRKHKQYRDSAYTVPEYKKLSYAEQRRVNAECDQGARYELDPAGKKPPVLLPPAAPLVYRRHQHPESGRDYVAGEKPQA